MSSPVKVAVVDDDKSARTSLARLIKTAGIEVVAFSSAQEFLDDPIHAQVDCAVTDVRMPGVDGFKLQETLAETLPYLSVVFITGHGDIPMTVKAIRGGAVDFLEKPVDDEALLDAIRRAAERSRRPQGVGGGAWRPSTPVRASHTPRAPGFPVGHRGAPQQAGGRRSRR